MGYLRSIRWTSRGTSFTIQRDYEITLDNVNCASAEWESCSYSEDHNCGHTEDVFLSCKSDTPTGLLELRILTLRNTISITEYVIS